MLKLQLRGSKSNMTSISPIYDVLQLGEESPEEPKYPVAKDFVKLKSSKDGRVHNISLYNNLPLNRGGFLDAKAIVKKGDIVQKG